MTTKLKNRLRKMKFQRELDRQEEIEHNEDTQVWDRILRERTSKLIEKAA